MNTPIDENPNPRPAPGWTEFGDRLHLKDEDGRTLATMEPVSGWYPMPYTWRLAAESADGTRVEGYELDIDEAKAAVAAALNQTTDTAATATPA